MEVQAEQAKTKVVAMVRNQQGQPLFDDYDSIPEVFHSALTEEDWIFINEKRSAR